ncbi:MAG: hypothetical protein LBM04_00265 [Opitutaceae bacterium]|nr:hypothetical protein [Opitutaceae bacterium]
MKTTATLLATLLTVLQRILAQARPCSIGPRLRPRPRMVFAGLFALALPFAAFPLSSRAALIAEDDFDSYTPGRSLIGQTAGGAGWGAAWGKQNAASTVTISNAPADLISHTLDNGDVLGSATSGAVLVISSTATANGIDCPQALVRNFATVPDAGSDVFLSFIFKIKDLSKPDGAEISTHNLAEWFARDAGAANTDTAGSVGFGGGRFTALVNNTRSSTVGGMLVYGRTYFAVVKYTGWNGSAYRTAQVWLNPRTTDENIAATTITRTKTAATGGSSAMTGLRVRTYNLTAINTGAATGRYHVIDAVRVGTTWASVTGQPAPGATGAHPATAAPAAASDAAAATDAAATPAAAPVRAPVRGVRAQSPLFTMDFSYASRHVFRGLKQTNDSFQPSLDIPIAKAVAGIRANMPGTASEDYEIDLHVGYRTGITKKLHADTLLTLYYYPEAEGLETQKSYEAGGGLAYDLFGLTVNARLYYDFRKDAATVQGGLSKSVPIKIGSFKTSLDIDACIGSVSSRNWTPDGNVWSPDRNYKTKESYNYYGGSVRIPYKLSRQATVHVEINYADHDGIRQAAPKFWFRSGIAVSF